MKGPLAKQQRRKNALERRKKELSFWKSCPDLKTSDELQRKVKICEQDIKNLERKM